MISLVLTYKRATVTQVKNGYKQGIQKTISEYIACQLLKQHTTVNATAYLSIVADCGHPFLTKCTHLLMAVPVTP